MGKLDEGVEQARREREQAAAAQASAQAQVERLQREAAELCAEFLKRARSAGLRRTDRWETAKWVDGVFRRKRVETEHRGWVVWTTNSFAVRIDADSGSVEHWQDHGDGSPISNPIEGCSAWALESYKVIERLPVVLGDLLV